MADNQMGLLAALMGQQGSLSALGQGYGNATKRYETNYLDPYTQTGGQANTLYSNSLGLGGAQGNQAATDAFQTGPGYQFALDQGLQALNRNAASRGMLASGNNTQDILKYSQGLANQEYGNWQNRLGTLGQQGLQAAGAQTNRQGALAGLDTGYGQGAANVYQNTANSLMDLYKPQQQQSSGLGSALAGGLNLGGSLLGLGMGGITGGSLGGGIGSALGRFFQ